MGTLFEQYIATTIEGELSRLLDVFSQARRNAFGVVEQAVGFAGTFGIERHNSDTTELRRMYIDAGRRGRSVAALSISRAIDAMGDKRNPKMLVRRWMLLEALIKFTPCAFGNAQPPYDLPERHVRTRRDQHMCILGCW